MISLLLQGEHQRIRRLPTMVLMRQVLQLQALLMEALPPQLPMEAPQLMQREDQLVLRAMKQRRIEKVIAKDVVCSNITQLWFCGSSS
jgi:hypothetical protein